MFRPKRFAPCNESLDKQNPRCELALNNGMAIDRNSIRSHLRPSDFDRVPDKGICILQLGDVQIRTDSGDENEIAQSMIENALLVSLDEKCDSGYNTYVLYELTSRFYNMSKENEDKF